MLLSNRYKVVQALAPAVPSSSTPTRISTKNVLRLLAVISVKNATTVTGSAITLKQSTTVAGGSEKALSFTTYYANTDTGASDTLVATTASSDTFTTDSTNSKNLLYIIDIDPASLDTNNGFDVVRVGTGNATAATVDVVYVVQTKDNPAIGISLITD